MEDSLRGCVGGLCTWAKDTEDLYHGWQDSGQEVALWNRLGNVLATG